MMLPKPVPQTLADPLQESEESLVAAARGHDEVAVRELVRRLNPRLFHVARGILDNDAEAEETVQDAYLAAFKRLDEFRGEARFSTWITRITLNAAMMRRRARRPQEEYDTVSETETEGGDVLAFPSRKPESPESALGRVEVRTMLEGTVAELPPELRLVFLMREVQGLSVMTIARDLSLNPVTVKTRLFRARRRLRSALEAQLKGGFEAVFPFAGARCARMADRVAAQLRLNGLL